MQNDHIIFKFSLSYVRGHQSRHVGLFNKPHFIGLRRCDRPYLFNNPLAAQCRLHRLGYLDTNCLLLLITPLIAPPWKAPAITAAPWDEGQTCLWWNFLPQLTLPSHSYVAESTTQVIWGHIRLRAISNNWNLEVCQEVLWSFGHFSGGTFYLFFQKQTHWLIFNCSVHWTLKLVLFGSPRPMPSKMFVMLLI